MTEQIVTLAPGDQLTVVVPAGTPPEPAGGTEPAAEAATGTEAGDGSDALAPGEPAVTETGDAQSVGGDAAEAGAADQPASAGAPTEG